MSLAWFVVHCHPRAEAGVSDNLAEEGFEVFFPKYLKKVVHGRRRLKIPAPYFPCYTFVRFDVLQPTVWRPINRAVGAVGLLCSTEETPLAVAEPLVAELLNSVGPDGYIKVTDESKPIRYHRGQFLRILDGAFVGFIGHYIGSDRQRVEILLDVLGGARPVHVPSEHVELAEAPKIQKTTPHLGPYRRRRRLVEKKGAPVTAPPAV